MHRLVQSARYRALRLRHDWWYRWAHDPLCDRLGAGVLKIGKLRVCRSCVAMYSGIAVGGVAAVALPPLGAASAAPAVWLGSASACAAASTPPVYKGLSRQQKDAVRFGTGVTGGLLVAFLTARRWRWLLLLSAIAAVGYRVLTLARAKSKASACQGCPELNGDQVCSGFAQQAVAFRAYEEKASEIAMRAYQPA